MEINTEWFKGRFKEPTNVDETIQMYKYYDMASTRVLRDAPQIDLYDFRRFCRKAIRKLKKFKNNAGIA